MVDCDTEYKKVDIDPNIKNIAIGDFIHDFTTFGLAGDTILMNRETRNYNYITKFTYSILAESLNLAPKYVICNSGLKAPTFKITPSYDKHTLEHMFYKELGVKGINELEDTEKYKIVIIDVKTPDLYVQAYEPIHDFFDTTFKKPIDSDTILPIVVDAQTKLFKIIKEAKKDKKTNNKYFGYCLNQEVINDAAGKKNFNQPVTIDFIDYYLAENKSNPFRVYNKSEFGGVFDVKFNKIGIDSNSLRPTTEVHLIGTREHKHTSILNSSSNHPSSRSKINKECNSIRRENLVTHNKLCSDNLIKIDVSNKDDAYKDIIKNIKEKDELNKFKEEMNRIFTMKRIGDQLQALSCKKSITYDIRTDNGTVTKNSITINKAVYVTYDHLAALFAIKNGIPVIFEHSKSKKIILIKPILSSSGGSNGSKSDLASSSKPIISKYSSLTNESLRNRLALSETTGRTRQAPANEKYYESTKLVQMAMENDFYNLREFPDIFLRIVYYWNICNKETKGTTITALKKQYNDIIKSELEYFDTGPINPNVPDFNIIPSKRLVSYDKYNAHEEFFNHESPDQTFIFISNIVKISKIDDSHYGYSDANYGQTWEKQRQIDIDLKTLSNNIYEYSEKYEDLLDNEDYLNIGSLEADIDEDASGGSKSTSSKNKRKFYNHFIKYYNNYTKYGRYNNINNLLLMMYLKALNDYEMITLINEEKTIDYFDLYHGNNDIIPFLMPKNTELYFLVEQLILQYINDITKVPSLYLIEHALKKYGEENIFSSLCKQELNNIMVDLLDTNYIDITSKEVNSKQLTNTIELLKPIIQKANLKHNKYEKAISKNTTLKNAIRVSNDFNISFTTHGTNFKKVITGKYKSRASVKRKIVQSLVAPKIRTKKIKPLYSMPFSMSQMVSVGGPGRTGFGKRKKSKKTRKPRKPRKKLPKKTTKKEKKHKKKTKVETL
jgi:hypothetical protein